MVRGHQERSPLKLRRKKDMKLNVEVKATKEQIDEVVNSEVLTKSGKIKELFNLGLEVKEIQKVTGIVYNMCYNVITNYVLTNGLEVVKEKRVSKKQLIFEMFDQGKTNMEVAKDTQTNYNYVCKLKKEWKSSLVTNTGAEEVAMTVEEEEPTPVKGGNIDLNKEMEKAKGPERDKNGKFVSNKDKRRKRQEEAVGGKK